MAAIETIVLVVAGITFIVIASLAVIIIGIHQEERRLTLGHEEPPTGPALLTRRVLGAHFAPRADEEFAARMEQLLPEALAGNPPAAL
jgi:hypothetical protein